MNVKVRVSATTSNLGSGFDVFGAALPMYSEYGTEYVRNVEKTSFTLKSNGKKTLPKGEKNLVWHSMQETFKFLGETKYNLKNLNITINSDIALNVGLGSSSSAKVVLCIPSFELRTKRSRQILSKSLGLKDVVFDTLRVALLTAAFCCQDYPLLKQAMKEWKNKAYRGKMIPAMNEVLKAALEADAHEACFSGGSVPVPTLAAFCDKKDTVNVQKLW